MTQPIDPSIQPPEPFAGDKQETHSKRYAWMWGSVVVAFLLLQLVIGGLAFNLASGDPSVAVMPDYHERALKWDDELARRQRSDRLGWKVEFGWSDQEEIDGGRRFIAKVVDRHGEAISGGEASLRFFHHTRGGDVATMDLVESESGQYVASLPMAKRGLWDIEFSLGRGDEEAFWKQATIAIGIDPESDPVKDRGSPATDGAE